MNKKQISTGIISFLFLTGVMTTPAFAVNTPAFSSCLNPQSPQANLQITNTGTHGVPGNEQAFTGVDKVYSSESNLLSSATVMQCLCPDNGQGIQTNWWKVSELSEEERKTLEAQGWIYIPEGSAWGLDHVPYLAQNTNYSCKSSNQESSSGQNNSNSNNNSSSNQNVLGAATQAVLGLANTGDIIFLYSVLGIGILSFGIAFLLKKNI